MATEFPFEPRPKRLRWRWILFAFVLLLLGAGQIYRLSLATAVKRELAALERAGYPVNVTQLEARRGSIPDRQNAALRVLEAADFLVVEADAFSRDRWPAGNEPLDPEEKEALELTVTNNAPALEALHSTVRLNDSKYPVDLSRGPAALLPHLAKIKSLSQLLKAETILLSEAGQTDLAVRAVLDSLALARSLDKEPILISQLVRNACLAITCSSLQRLLTQHALPEAQLAELLGAIRGAREVSSAAFATGYQGEICLGTFCFQARPSEFRAMFDGDSDASAWLEAVYPLYAWTGIKDRDFLFYLRAMRQVLDNAQLPFPENLTKARETGAQTERALQQDKFLLCSRMLLPALQRSTEKAVESEARLRCAEAALILEQHRGETQGSPPESLDQLGKAGAPGLPLDPVDGAPLRYHRLSPGYVIYSLGPDGTDQGGTERRRNASSGVRKWPPDKAETRNGNGGIKGFDVTFAVER